MHQSAAFCLGATPGGPTVSQEHLSRLPDICCPRVWGKISLLFIEIAAQGADPGDLLVSGIPYRRFPGCCSRCSLCALVASSARICGLLYHKSPAEFLLVLKIGSPWELQPPRIEGPFVF